MSPYGDQGRYLAERLDGLGWAVLIALVAATCGVLLWSAWKWEARHR